ncbi:MAG: hypothetical protein ABR557_01090 [Pyrinomonadaceae bacterium]
MKIILLIALLESLAITSWLVLRHYRTEYALITAAAIVPVVNKIMSTSALSSPEASRWHFINGWNVEAQADDRRLTLGSVVERAGSAPALRSFARRSHQRSFKAWSQERHD